MRAEADAHAGRLVEAYRGGQPADGPVAMDLAEEHRAHIGRWFYDCPPAVHRALGDMYVADARFTKTYEDMAPGLAVWVRDAWTANAARQGR
jgi:MerR family transcriptional regulator, thiopeptide resistance regulator